MLSQISSTELQVPKPTQPLLIYDHDQLRLQEQFSELWKLIYENLLWSEVILIMYQSLLVILLEN